VAVSGGSWWLGATRGLGRWHVPTQTMAGSFPAWAVDVFFLFGFKYSCLFTVHLCNRLILYGLLGGF